MASDKIILGLDPGTNVMGFGIISFKNQKLKVLQYGVIKMIKEKDHLKKLKIIFETVNNLINEYKPNEISIESPFYGKNVQSMLKLGRAQGVAMVAGEINKISITEYAPKKIKQAVTGNGNASKEQLNKMIQKILNIKILDSNKLDASDALGAALCHHFQSNLKNQESSSWKKFISKNKIRIIN